MKRIVAAFLSLLVMLLCLNPICIATDSTADNQFANNTELFRSIEAALDHSITSSNIPGFTAGNSYMVGKPISVFEYKNGKLEQMRFLSYPLFNDGVLIGFAWVTPDGNSYSSVIQTMHIDSFRRLTDKVVFIYDADSCYAVNEDNCYWLYSFNEVEERDYWCKANTLNENLEYNYIRPECRLSKMSIESTRSSATCNVSYVPQGTNTNICWAACIACIGNYLNGTSYSAVNIAQSLYGSDYNYGLQPAAAVAWLNYYCSLSYTHSTNTLTNNKLYQNLSSGYPVYGGFNYTYGSTTLAHACVIYSINTSTGNFSYMNPETGLMTNGAKSGTQFYFYDSAAKYWFLSSYGVRYV